MKKLIKLAIVFVIFILFCLTLPETSTEAKEYTTDSGISYTVVDGEVTITRFITLDSGYYYMPDYIEGYPVTAIGDGAFQGCQNVDTIRLPDSVRSIGNDAFSHCENMSSITIPSNVTTIGDYAFAYCYGLITITIPDEVQHIGKYAFYYCSGLWELYIGNGVQSIGDYAFEKCNNLSYNSLNSCKYLGNAKNPYMILMDTSSTSIKSVTISENTKFIYKSAFSACKYLTEIVIPKGVIGIGDYAFYNCSGLTSISIPDSVTQIGYSAFSGCASLNYSIYGEGKYLGNANNPYFALIDTANTTLKTCDIHSAAKLIGEAAFENCTELTGVVFPGSIIAVSDSAFKNCSSLIEITLPDSVIRIGLDAFRSCSSLTTVDMGDGVTSIGVTAFYGCSNLNSVDMGNSVISIGKSAFDGCSNLTSVNMGNSVKSIGNYAFNLCSSLTSLDLGVSVTSIGEKTFNKCTKLTIRCISGSYTENYAKEKGIAYILLCNHDFSDWIEQKAATCTEDGRKIRACILCGMEEVQVIAMLNHCEVIQEAVAPTCTETGLTEGKYCSSCNGILQEQQIIDATGHSYDWLWISPTHMTAGYDLYTCSRCGDSYEEGYYPPFDHSWIETVIDADCTVDGMIIRSCDCGMSETEVIEAVGHSYDVVITAPTCSQQGYTTHTCTACGDSYADDYMDVLGHSFENSVCSLCGIEQTAKIEQWSITLGDMLGLNFCVNIKEKAVNTTVVMVTIGDQSHRFDAADTEPNEEGRYIFSVNLAAAQMGDTVTVTAIVNEEVLENNQYSVRQYADYILSGDYDVQTKQLVRDMLSFGAAAQIYFGYHTDSLANAGVEGAGNEKIGSVSTEMTVSDRINGIDFYGASLLFRSKTAVRFYFNGDVTGCTFMVFETAYAPIEKDGIWYIEVADIAPQMLDTVITLTVCRGEDTIMISYSPMDYMVRMSAKDSGSLKALLKAMYNYHLSAVAYSKK